MWPLDSCACWVWVAPGTQGLAVTSRKSKTSKTNHRPLHTLPGAKGSSGHWVEAEERATRQVQGSRILCELRLQAWDIHHCPIRRCYQNTDSKTKVLRISRPLLQSIKPSMGPPTECRALMLELRKLRWRAFNIPK